jgi:hypothetical protein
MGRINEAFQKLDAPIKANLADTKAWQARVKSFSARVQEFVRRSEAYTGAGRQDGAERDWLITESLALRAEERHLQLEDRRLTADGRAHGRELDALRLR